MILFTTANFSFPNSHVLSHTGEWRYPRYFYLETIRTYKSGERNSHVSEQESSDLT